jgi:hypothetical protein
VALGDARRPVHARSRADCCSTCTALYLGKTTSLPRNVTVQVVALCATIQHLAASTGKAPTISTLLIQSRSGMHDWASDSGAWTKKMRAFLIFYLIGPRKYRILRFVASDNDEVGMNRPYSSAPVAVNSLALAEHVQTLRQIIIPFPDSACDGRGRV